MWICSLQTQITMLNCTWSPQQVCSLQLWPQLPAQMPTIESTSPGGWVSSHVLVVVIAKNTWNESSCWALHMYAFFTAWKCIGKKFNEIYTTHFPGGRGVLKYQVFLKPEFYGRCSGFKKFRDMITSSKMSQNSLYNVIWFSGALP